MRAPAATGTTNYLGVIVGSQYSTSTNNASPHYFLFVYLVSLGLGGLSVYP